jgi:hypothetical protein
MHETRSAAMDCGKRFVPHKARVSVDGKKSTIQLVSTAAVASDFEGIED